MEPVDTIKKLEDSKVYSDWKKDHPESYLVHSFMMLDTNNESPWQIGLYVKSHDKVVTFFMDDEIKVSDEEEAFKKDKKAIDELDLGIVKIGYDEALQKAKDLQKAKYPNDKPQKTILILQNIDGGTVYNITFVTASFNTLNIKINPDDGEVKSHKLTSLMDMAEKVK